jgi:hypothetical protein
MLVFVDETGDHDLTKIDPLYPFFGLGALIIGEEMYEKLDAAIRDLKIRYFNDDGTFILHLKIC